MDAEAGLSVTPVKEICTVDTKSLVIKIASAGKKQSVEETLATVTPDSMSKKNSWPNSLGTSPCSSPLASPPSSAFASALQSPYISPRATLVTNPNPNPNPCQENSTLTGIVSPPGSYSGPLSDEVPSASYTPPPENDDPANTKLKIVTCVPESAPRISFSFPVPRISLAKGSVSPASNVKLRSCDVYIGFYGGNPNLIRFCKWLKSELEVQGIACFVADRAKYTDTQSHDTADRVICSVTFGLVVVTSYSLRNHLSLEEIRFFSQKNNLIPLFFDTDANEIASLFHSSSDNKECKEAVDGIMKCHEYKLEANDGNWRCCVSKAAQILKGKLGRMSAGDNEVEMFDEIPFPRNRYFVGKEREMMEIGNAFFRFGDYLEGNRGGTPGQSEGLADGESDADTVNVDKYVNLKEPLMGKNSLKRPKYKNSKSGKHKSGGSSVLCINGSPGLGKTELALEFAHQYSQRYKMVLWVGGETRYLRQNIMNLSLKMGLDVTADEEKDRGSIRSFDEQESEAFKRFKREIFRDLPYLLIIDNLESESEGWDGKDLHDLIPRNTGGTHVIITTRLSKVANFDTLQLQPLLPSDAIALVTVRRRRKEYPATELGFLRKFDEKLQGSSFGLRVIGSLLSELEVTPSGLFEAVDQIQYEEKTVCSGLSTADQQFCRNNPFLMKLMSFCAAVLQQVNGNKNLLSSRMLQAGAWFAPAPILVNSLAAAANCIESTKTKHVKWIRCLKLNFRCCSGYLTRQTWNSEENSALLLVKFGLARRVNRRPGCWIQFHPITQLFGKRICGLMAAKATVQGIWRTGNPVVNSDHFWASVFLVFGFKSEPSLVQLKATDMVLFIKKTALPIAIRAFTNLSMCNSALELLKVCTSVLEEVEKCFVSQTQGHRSVCWKKVPRSNQKVDEYVWQEVTLLKAILLETRAKLLLRGGHFECAEELCRTCISIRTVMLGHNHAQTLAAQETLAKLVRMRSKM
ncbi:hypothetical protein F511_00319 [Dorcoceras hygrometricum]|nr:hypothetical protein F511_00319 [Dorcoceras hygrometricum]